MKVEIEKIDNGFVVFALYTKEMPEDRCAHEIHKTDRVYFETWKEVINYLLQPNFAL